MAEAHGPSWPVAGEFLEGKRYDVACPSRAAATCCTNGALIQNGAGNAQPTIT
jgi:hypothetical protein